MTTNRQQRSRWAYVYQALERLPAGATLLYSPCPGCYHQAIGGRAPLRHCDLKEALKHRAYRGLPTASVHHHNGAITLTKEE